MGSVNQVNLLGNVCFDTELRKVGDAVVCDLRLACNERVKRGDEWVEEPVYVDVTCWNRTAEIADEYLSRGSQVHIEGRLKLDLWDDKDTGEKRQKLKVVCNKLTLLGKGGGGDKKYSHDNGGMVGSVEMPSVPF
jgi:single-strand DNA-binding protein